MFRFLEESVAKRYAFCVLLLLFSLTSLTFAQTANTSLRGSIKDPSGAVVPGATITLTDNTSGKVLQTTSNASGDYQFNQIPPAKYNIKVSANGFGDQQKFAELLVNQPATIDFAMTVQASTEVINVTAATQTLNTTDASLGNASEQRHDSGAAEPDAQRARSALAAARRALFPEPGQWKRHRHERQPQRRRERRPVRSGQHHAGWRR